MGFSFFSLSDNSSIKMASAPTCHLKRESQSAVQFHFLYPGSGHIQPLCHNVIRDPCHTPFGPAVTFQTIFEKCSD